MTNGCYWDKSQIECSNHGVCISKKCHCNSGWSNVSWFSAQSDQQCFVNIKACVALACIVFVLTLLTSLIIIYYFSKRLRKSKFNIHDHKISFPCLGFIYCCFMSIISGVYVFRQENFDEYGIGVSVWYTLLFSIGHIFYYWSVLDSNQNLYLFLKGYYPMMTASSKSFMVQTLGRASSYKPMLFYVSLYVFLLLGSLTEKYYYLIGIIFNDIYGAWYLYSVIFRISPFYKFVIQQFDDTIRDNHLLRSSDKQELNNVRKRIINYRLYQVTTGSIYGILFILLGSWPYLLRTSTYIYMVGIMLNIAVTIESVLQIMPSDTKPAKVKVVPKLENENPPCQIEVVQQQELRSL